MAQFPSGMGRNESTNLDHRTEIPEKCLAVYEYNSEGNLVYEYGSNGQRVFQRDINGQPVWSYTPPGGNGPPSDTEVYIDGDWIGAWEDGTLLFVGKDWIGTKRYESLGQGSSISEVTPETYYSSSYTSLPFGDNLSSIGQDLTHFTGKERDAESGLDYFYDRSPHDVQQECFRAHIRAARLAGLPLAIHARDADADIARILRDERDTGGEFAFLLHCFSSSRALAEAAVAMGGYVSFSGILTFPKSTELREIARDLPPDRLLVETDAPYLAPVPLRGKRNEPAYVAHTARVLADVRQLEPDALANLTTANFRNLFRKAA